DQYARNAPNLKTELADHLRKAYPDRDVVLPFEDNAEIPSNAPALLAKIKSFKSPGQANKPTIMIAGVPDESTAHRFNTARDTLHGDHAIQGIYLLPDKDGIHGMKDLHSRFSADLFLK
ncbi:MAG: hypothetical protein K9G62_08000, partial [Alphaproteobacteria bacterium]|nr:hypothetical protein [Alphaproteobacteria bacterium]